MDTHFFAGLTKFKLDAGKFRRDDDFSDRFSHTFTTLLLVIFTLIISARQYIGKPIACWVPTEFTRAQEEYAESVCWVTSTYFIATGEVSVPIKISDRENRKLHYYQWVPFILMIQAFLFNLPCIVWRLFNWQSGIHLSSIMEVACEIEMIKDPDMRKSNVNYVARHIEDSLTTQREYRSGCAVRLRQYLAKTCCLWFGKRYGNYLICLYLITKSLYILNVLGQIFFMSELLGTKYTFYGIDLLRDIAQGVTWRESGNFPRITLCDFEVRQLANIHRHTVQCVLPINMFNEKIFIFLWFWFILVAAVNTSSFLYWSYKSSFHTNRLSFIRKFLRLREALESGDKKRTHAFVDSYLRQDGVFILRLVAQNAGELVASEIVERLWILYKSRQIVSVNQQIEVGGTKLSSSQTNIRSDRDRSTPHRHHHHHRPRSHHSQLPSPTTSTNPNSQQSIPSSSKDGSEDHSILVPVSDPPLYSAEWTKPHQTSVPPPPPIHTVGKRSLLPPPLPPLPSSTNKTNTLEHRNSSTIGQSQISNSQDDGAEQASTSKPVNQSSAKRKSMDRTSRIQPKENKNVTSTADESGTNNDRMSKNSHNEDDPGEFV